MVAYLLEIDNTILSKTFETRVMETSRGGQRGTTYNVPLNCPQVILFLFFQLLFPSFFSFF